MGAPIHNLILHSKAGTRVDDEKLALDFVRRQLGRRRTRRISSLARLSTGYVNVYML
jgi:hypothetical protein